ncbi:type IVB secretion system protein IcmH/DotU [Pseudomonas sp. MAFF 301350]|uniref:Type IVB secretion system protein IcmH/DotU n=2 Tax=Pseudomonas aegrilactucae TaxID=2854028 RepID=A0A9Q3ADB8_9PSED|nr:type IVB secretion system protein IcmH/DotU [Pseudomonas aegrilactucae]
MQRASVAGAAIASSENTATEIDHYLHDPEFRLRGAFKNPMLDAAMALFGLSFRLATLDHHDNVKKLYDDVSNQIRTILEEVRQLEYDDASFKAYSYSLCLFMDETVMGRPWGVRSIWSHHPLLSEFHKETWGGEKFFTLLERMSTEAARYQDVVEFMYFCVCLGLKGKYAVHDKGDEEIQKLITRLQRIIRELRGPTPQQLTDPLANVAPRNFRISRQWPWWSPWLAASMLLAGIYAVYSLRLNTITQQVLQSLDNILKL